MEYSIGAFSKLTKLSIDTLRYYEKIQLIIPKRNSINRRIYTDKDIEWIDFVKRLKQTGMPIKSMQKYAYLRYQGDDTVKERLNLLFEQQKALIKQREEVESHIEFLDNKIEIYQEMLKNK